MVELGPTVRKWAVAEGLKYMRVASNAGTQGEVAEKIHRKRASVGHWEEGRSLPSHDEINGALKVYGFAELAPYFCELRDRAKTESEWWDGTASKDFLPETLRAFLAFERSAVEIFGYETQFVPDLLQIQAYAERLLCIEQPGMGDAEIELSLLLHTERQAVLDRAKPLKASWVIDEAALRREVGGPEVLRDQLTHLAELARRPNVEIRVLTYRGSAEAAARGDFMIMSLPLKLEALSEVGYSRTAAEQIRYQERAELDAFHETAARLRGQALPARESLTFLEELAGRLTG